MSELETGENPLKVVIVAGGLGHERDISIRSGIRVGNALKERGFVVETIDFDAQFFTNLDRLQPDVVFPLIHGEMGENGSLPDMLALAGYPFVGTDGRSARVAADKPSAKSVFHLVGLPTPAFVTLSQKLFRTIGSGPILERLSRQLSYPVMVKPALGGSGLGVNLANSDAELRSALVEAFSYYDTVLIEQFIRGVDVAVSLVCFAANTKAEGPSRLNRETRDYLQQLACCPELMEISPQTAITMPVTVQTLPAIEIAAEGPYDYDARYNAGRVEYFIPPRLEAGVIENAKLTARKAHEVLGLRQLSRIDLVVDEHNTPWVIDVNAYPGMTDTSLWPQAANASAGDVPGAPGFGDILASLVYSALLIGPRPLDPGSPRSLTPPPAKPAD